MQKVGLRWDYIGLGVAVPGTTQLDQNNGSVSNSQAMEPTPFAITLIVVGYLLGSISSAILVCKLIGLPDPRTQGSGNPGATNVLRVGGKKAAAVTLLGDMLKGLLPVMAAQLLAMSTGVIAAVAVAAILGHLFPVFFGFRGGKGVATSLGALLAAAWPVGLAVVITWLLVFAASRISSLSALTAFVLAPFYAWWLQGEPVFIAAVVFITLLLIWRHRSNIRKLLSGSEGGFRSERK